MIFNLWKNSLTDATKFPPVLPQMFGIHVKRLPEPLDKQVASLIALAA